MVTEHFVQSFDFLGPVNLGDFTITHVEGLKELAPRQMELWTIGTWCEPVCHRISDLNEGTTETTRDKDEQNTGINIVQ